MNLNFTTRAAAFVASLLMTFAVVDLIADYAKPADAPQQMALHSADGAAGAASAATRR